MEEKAIRTTALLVVFCSLTLSAPESCVKNQRPLIIALLTLHSGSDCKLVVQKGAQQIAALELTLDQINEETQDLKFDLKVMDTCSSKEEAVKAGLRALVYIEQTCTKPPLFLGFLGPDDPAGLKAVSKVSGLFQYTHVVPAAVRGYGQFNAINVHVIDPVEKAKNIKLLLGDMNWASFLLVHTSDSSMTQTASRLLEHSELCILYSVLQIPSSTTNVDGTIAYNRLLHSLQQVHEAKVVILSDTAESAENLLHYLDGVATHAKFLLYLQGTGILPWKLSEQLAHNVLILQETTNSNQLPDGFVSYLENSTLWTTSAAQYTPHVSCVDTCKSTTVLADASILPLVHSLHLYAKGLRTIHASKCSGSGLCKRMTEATVDEWKTALEGATTFNAGHKIRFYMKSEDFVDLILYNSTGYFQQIGTIHTAKYQNLKNAGGLFRSEENAKDQCAEDMYHLVTDPPVLEVEAPQPPTTAPEEKDLLGLIFTHTHIGYWELVGTLIGAASGIILVIVIFTCLIYRSFKVRSKDKFSEASSTSAQGGSPGHQPPAKKGDKRGSVRSNCS